MVLVAGPLVLLSQHVQEALLIARGWEGRPGAVAYACAAEHCQSLCCCASAPSPGHCHYILTHMLQQQLLKTLFHTAFHS